MYVLFAIEHTLIVSTHTNRHLKMLLEQHPLLLASFGMTVDMVKQEIEKATALEKLKVGIPSN